MAAEDGKKQLHVVMFPWLAFGHMIPFLELSKFIAQKGHRVSFVSTPRNILRLPKLPPHLSSLVHFVTLSLPQTSGLPDGAEATSDIPPAAFPCLKRALDGLEPELTRFLKDSAPDWVIYDFAPHWLPPVAAGMRISHAYFSNINAWFISFLGPCSSVIDGSDPRSNPEDFTIPPKWAPVNSRVAYRLCEAEWIAGARKSDDGVSDAIRILSVISGSEVIFIRDSREFEPDWLTVLEEIHQKPVVPVGLMPPSMQDSTDDNNNESWGPIRDWLDQWESGSVVYVALGSEVAPSQEQLNELALGLELSGLPFFWTLRKPAGSAAKLPDGFEGRVRGHGLVWTSWVPQLSILSHDSVGGFLTHCGWSSIIEGLQFGRPLIMLPFVVDQGLNARVCEAKMVGIEIPRDERDGSFTRNSVAESLSLIMAKDDPKYEGKIYRERAKEMSAMFGDKFLRDKYLDNFVNFLEDHRRGNKKSSASKGVGE